MKTDAKYENEVSRLADYQSNILIIGGGKGGNSLLELLMEDRTSNIVGVVDS